MPPSGARARRGKRLLAAAEYAVWPAFVVGVLSLGAVSVPRAWSNESLRMEAAAGESPTGDATRALGPPAWTTNPSALPAWGPATLLPEPGGGAPRLPGLTTETPQSYPAAEAPWTLQVMPAGLMYRSYLAGAKEPRFASYWNTDRDQGKIWDTALGGRLGLLRYGTCDPIHPEGWQIDMEGGCLARLDPDSDSNCLFSTDFRAGIPVTWAQGGWQFKTGYYHISSHLGDEFLLRYPTARRLNYTRDAIMLGVGFFCTERLRLYGETAYALGATDGAKPWEFQCGADWAPAGDTGLWGAPFAAVNCHLREDVDFGGNLVLQTGWAWRSLPRGSLFRLGVEYYRGKSDQFEYYDREEERIGWGLWVDF